MANVHFVLRNNKAKTPQQIYLRYRLSSIEDFKHPLSIKVLPKHWHKEAERVKNVIEVKERHTINNFLLEVAKEVETFKNECVAKKEAITKENLKAFLVEYLTPTNPKHKTLFGFIEHYIEQSKTRVNTHTGKTLSRFPLVAYGTLLTNLKEFQKGYKRQIDFNTIDLDFYNDFTAFLTGKKLAVNTIAKKITTLKTILNAATDKGINTYTAYKSKRFAAITEESESIYLKESELEVLSELNLSQNNRLERVRDLFLLGAFTGLRFSDFSRLTSDNIQGDFISINQSKTGGRVVIPLHPIVKEILNRNGGKAPRALTNQKMNEYLKELGQAANLNEIVSKTITKGGQQITVNRPKYELLSTHTARRSFATNLFKSRYPTHSIMQITGHKTEKAFLKYIKATKEEHAQLLALHWKTNTKLKAV